MSPIWDIHVTFQARGPLEKSEHKDCQSQRSGRTGGKLSSGPYEKLHWVNSAARQHSSIGREGFRRSLALTKGL